MFRCILFLSDFIYVLIVISLYFYQLLCLLYYHLLIWFLFLFIFCYGFCGYYSFILFWICLQPLSKSVVFVYQVIVYSTIYIFLLLFECNVIPYFINVRCSLHIFSETNKVIDFSNRSCIIFYIYSSVILPKLVDMLITTLKHFVCGRCQ